MPVATGERSQVLRAEVRYRGKEKWQTVGAGEAGRRQAQELAAEINRQLEEERAREESEFLDCHRAGAALVRTPKRPRLH